VPAASCEQLPFEGDYFFKSARQTAGLWSRRVPLGAYLFRSAYFFFSKNRADWNFSITCADVFFFKLCHDFLF